MATELTINPETVRMLIQKTRAATDGVEDQFENGSGNEVEFDVDSLSDSHHHDGLAEEESSDLSGQELKALLEDLNVDEAADLVAIAWIGRGDFDPSDFTGARKRAQERAVGPTSDYLLGMPLLADYIEEGLDALKL